MIDFKYAVHFQSDESLYGDVDGWTVYVNSSSHCDDEGQNFLIFLGLRAVKGPKVYFSTKNMLFTKDEIPGKSCMDFSDKLMPAFIEDALKSDHCREYFEE